MQIVIEIPEKDYKKAIEFGHLDMCGIELAKAVLNGTPLTEETDLISRKAVLDLPKYKDFGTKGNITEYVRVNDIKSIPPATPTRFLADWWNAPYKKGE